MIGGSNGYIFLFEEGKEMLSRFKAHEQAVSQILVEGSEMITIGAEGVIKEWFIEEGCTCKRKISLNVRDISSLTGEDKISILTAERQGNELIVGLSNELIVEVNIEGENPKIRVLVAALKGPRALALHPKRDSIIVAGQNKALVEMSYSLEIVRSKHIGGKAECASISPAGDHIAVGESGGEIEVFEYNVLERKALLKGK